MGYLGRRIGKSQDTGNSFPDNGPDVGGGILDLFANGYFQRQGKIYNAPGTSGSGITASGGVVSDYTTSPGAVYRAHVFTSSGKFTVTSLGTVFDTAESVEYVVVGGGGGGGQYGGAGAGGYRSSVAGESSGGGNSAESRLTVSTSPGEYAVTIGAGGEASEGNDGSNGTATSFGPISSLGGGYGARYNQPGGDGGSGGAAGDYPRNGRIGNATGYPGPTAQGYPGGNGFSDQTNYTSGGGGGGAGAQGGGGLAPTESVPSTDAPSTPADGGNGIRTLIAGPGPDGAGAIGTPGPASAGGYGGGAQTAVTNGWLAGGGGGGGNATGPNTGGAGGGGNGSGGLPGAVNTGGGGGATYGRGGSGIVVVRYQIAQITANAKASGGAISFYNNKTIHTFASSGSLVVPESISNVDYVVLAGGGGGDTADTSYAGGAGGAGGYILKEGQTLAAATYQIQVGAGGNLGAQGGPSVFNSQTAVGGGSGGKGSPGSGGAGGSGGGQAGGTGSAGAGQNFPGPTQQGYPGGDGSSGGGHAGGGGGFGGAGSASGPPDGGGPGGIGVQLPPAFRDPVQAPSDTTSVPYQRGGGLGTPGPAGGFYVAGGGGGGTWNPSYGTKGGDGGAGGGGRGAFGPSDGTPALDGVSNTGGGGGGSGVSINGSRGGSGLVIIAYPTD